MDLSANISLVIALACLNIGKCTILRGYEILRDYEMFQTLKLNIFYQFFYI